MTMILDFAGCYVMEKGCKALFASLEPAELVTRGRARREARRAEEERLKELEAEAATAAAVSEAEKKTQ